MLLYLLVRATNLKHSTRRRYRIVTNLGAFDSLYRGLTMRMRSHTYYMLEVEKTVTYNLCRKVRHGTYKRLKSVYSFIFLCMPMPLISSRSFGFFSSDRVLSFIFYFLKYHLPTPSYYLSSSKHWRNTSDVRTISKKYFYDLANLCSCS